MIKLSKAEIIARIQMIVNALNESGSMEKIILYTSSGLLMCGDVQPNLLNAPSGLADAFSTSMAGIARDPDSIVDFIYCSDVNVIQGGSTVHMQFLLLSLDDVLGVSYGHR